MADKKKSKDKAARASDAVVADLKKQVKKLTAQLKKADAERKELTRKLTKQRAKAKKAAATVIDHAVEVVEKKTPIDVPPAKKAPARTPAKKATPVKSTGSVSASGKPDASWTVTRLRAAAKTQGVTGYSRKTKDQLLAELS